VQWRDHTRQLQSAMPAPLARAVGLLGQSSYALFLIHFPVVMLGNALFARLHQSGSAAAMGVLLASWAISLALALLFQRWVEAPLSRLGGYRRKSAT